jgi:hypothetical protein
MIGRIGMPDMVATVYMCAPVSGAAPSRMVRAKRFDPGISGLIANHRCGCPAVVPYALCGRSGAQDQPGVNGRDGPTPAESLWAGRLHRAECYYRRGGYRQHVRK